MVMNIIVRNREEGYSVEFKRQNVVYMTCETASNGCAILGPKLGSTEGTKMGIQLGLLVQLDKGHEYRPVLKLYRTLKTGLRE